MSTKMFVTPKVFRTGFTEVDERGLRAYLEYSGNTDFIKTWDAAREEGLKPAEILCSVFAKLCYKSLTVGQNSNITRTRDIYDNLVNCFNTGHGSIFEHVMFNFIVTDCSRVFTHELVRHRIGTAFSQTSGRYCRLDNLQMVWDPILDPAKDLFERCLGDIANTIYLVECRLGLRVPPEEHPDVEAEHWLHNKQLHAAFKWVPNNDPAFAEKKKITSAIRRIAPNGLANEIAFSVNLRSLRHTILMRTARFAEQEIRDVFGQVYQLIKPDYKTAFYGAKEEMVDGYLEITGMRCQPYEKTAQMALDDLTDEELEHYLKTRNQAERFKSPQTAV